MEIYCYFAFKNSGIGGYGEFFDVEIQLFIDYFADSHENPLNIYALDVNCGGIEIYVVHLPINSHDPVAVVALQFFRHGAIATVNEEFV